MRGSQQYVRFRPYATFRLRPHFKNYAEDVPMDPGRDRMSELPDHIILHILSFLPADDAVKTSILSKPWAYLWTNISCLDFCIDRLYDVRRYVSFVNSTLLLHRRSDVDKFSVKFMNYTLSFVDDVNRWVHLMTLANVKELTLDFYERNSPYVIPAFLYTNATLTKLRVSNCRIDSPVKISWNSLQSLCIRHTKLSHSRMADIFEGCPKLELIELSNCVGFNELKFSNRSLSKLLIRGYLERNATLEISAPNLCSLTISVEFRGKKCRVLNAVHLIDCCLDFNLEGANRDADREKEAVDMLTNLLEGLSNVKHFAIGGWCIQVLSVMEGKGLPFPMSGVEHLKLHTKLYAWELAGIAYLLRGCIYLDGLSIDMRTFPYSETFSSLLTNLPPKDVNYWAASEKIREGLNLRLKTVTISGLVPVRSFDDFPLHLIEFLVRNARFLENLTVRAVAISTHGFLEFSKKLLCFPRSSTNAVITILDSRKSKN